MSGTYNKLHAITVVAAAAVLANRFIAYDRGYATDAGGLKDSRGVSEYGAAAGEAFAVTTGYSQLVTAEEALAFGDYVKPGTAGQAVKGTATNHCGRALGAAVAGQLVEVEILPQVHAPAGQG